MKKILALAVALIMVLGLVACEQVPAGETAAPAAEDGKTVLKGLSYSDILLMLKWYKVLPR